jgi:superfamily II DNA or RNA helicase
MDLIQMELNKAGVDSEIYCGSLNSKERAAVLSKFPTESVTKKVLIIQIKAGGVGLNLQQFTSIFIVSPDWNPSNEIQAIARAHRIGQKKKVEVFKFTTIINEEFLEDEDKQYKISTIDQMIIKKQQFKRLLMAEVLNDVSLEFNESIEN